MKTYMSTDYSNKNLQKASFKNEDLTNANFSGSDLRGANFSGADLTGADFSKARTGITVPNAVWLFLVALVFSLASGYVAMRAGRTVQVMLASTDARVRVSGYMTLVLTAAFIVYFWWKGVITAISNLMIPILLAAAVIGAMAYFSGLGTGQGMLFMILAMILVVVMFIIGTNARTLAGSVSGILFVVVALSGGMFGKSMGGGIGTVIMAISSAVISKRASAGAKGFYGLQKLTAFITKKYGTSFRNATLTNANFSNAKIYNADFTNADISSINLTDAKKVNSIVNGDQILK
jgi:hypothetical protein